MNLLLNPASAGSASPEAGCILAGAALTESDLIG